MAVSLLSVGTRRVCRYRCADLFYLFAHHQFHYYSTAAPTLPRQKKTSQKPVIFGPKPKREASASPQRTSLALYETIKRDIKNKEPIRSISRKIFFALTIPTIPIPIARELFQIAINYHIEHDRMINGYLRAVSNAQAIELVQEVFQYFNKIKRPILVVQFGYLFQCWIGPKEMDLDRLDKIFQEIKLIIPPARLEQLYASYLAVYVHKKKFKKVDEIITQMRKEGITITAITYGAILSELLRNNPTQEEITKLMHQMDEDNIQPNRTLCNGLLNFLVKSGQIEQALYVAEMMEKQGVIFFEDSFLPLIDGFRKEGISTGVVQILQELTRRKIPLSRSIYTSVISMYCELKDMQTAIKILDTMKANNLTPFSPTYNCLINGFLKIDDEQGARNMLDLMKKESVTPDSRTFPHFIDHFREKKDLTKALEYVQMMRNSNLQIDHITYYTLVSLAIQLHGYGEIAKEIINKMIEEKVEPNDFLYRQMLIRECERGPKDSIIGIFDLMESRNVKFNRFQLASVLTSAVSRRPDLAWNAIQRAMLQRFDLKTLPPTLKTRLKARHLMHPIENGELD